MARGRRASRIRLPVSCPGGRAPAQRAAQRVAEVRSLAAQFRDLKEA